MTGPEHYREAEEWLEGGTGFESDADRVVRVITAQVHATLALAAATALGRSGDAYHAWLRAAGEQPEPAPAAPQGRAQPVPYDPNRRVPPPKDRGPRRSRDYDPDTDP
jgi:hypothetical protein